MMIPKFLQKRRGLWMYAHIWEPTFLVGEMLVELSYVLQSRAFNSSMFSTHVKCFFQMRKKSKLQFVSVSMKIIFLKLWRMATQFIKLILNASNSKPLCRYVNPSFSIILLQLNPIPNGSSPFFFASTIFHSQTLKMCGDHLVLTLLLKASDWQGCSIL